MNAPRLTRYRVDPGGLLSIMSEDEQGAYVRYDEAQARIAELEAALERLRLASSDMLDGISIHNERYAIPIQGPVVDAFRTATHSARRALEAKP